MTPLDRRSSADPATRASPSGLRSRRTGSGPDRRQEIAVVAADDALRASMCLLLTASGHTAIGYARMEDFHSQADRHRFACLVVDIERPITRALRQASRSPLVLPVIVLTVDPEGNAACNPLGLAGAMHCLSKPVPPDELLAVIARVVSSPPS